MEDLPNQLAFETPPMVAEYNLERGVAILINKQNLSFVGHKKTTKKKRKLKWALCIPLGLVIKPGSGIYRFTKRCKQTDKWTNTFQDTEGFCGRQKWAVKSIEKLITKLGIDWYPTIPKCGTRHFSKSGSQAQSRSQLTPGCSSVALSSVGIPLKRGP